MPICLLNAEAARSPNCATTLPTTEIIMHSVIMSGTTRYAKIPQKTMLPKTPPTAPSLLFFGLRCGQSLCFPTAIPTKYAIMSVPNDARNTSHIRMLYSLRSISTMWNGKSTQYRIPRRVADISSSFLSSTLNPYIIDPITASTTQSKIKDGIPGARISAA